MTDGSRPVSAEAEALRALLPSLTPEQRAAAEACLRALENRTAELEAANSGLKKVSAEVKARDKELARAEKKLTDTERKLLRAEKKLAGAENRLAVTGKKLAEAEEKAAEYQQADRTCRNLSGAFAKLRDRYASARQFISKLTPDEILSAGWSEAAFYDVFSNVFANLDDFLRRFTGENAGEQTGQDSTKRRARNAKRRPLDIDTALTEISRFRYGQAETVPTGAERKRLRAALDVLLKGRHLTDDEYDDLNGRLEKMVLPGEIEALSVKLDGLMKRFEKLHSGSASFHPGTKHAIKESAEPDTSGGTAEEPHVFNYGATGYAPHVTDGGTAAMPLSGQSGDFSWQRMATDIPGLTFTCCPPEGPGTLTVDFGSHKWQGPCPELMAEAAAALCDADCGAGAFNSGNRETSNPFLMEGQRLTAVAPGEQNKNGGYTVTLPDGCIAVWPEIPEHMTCPHCGCTETILSLGKTWWTMREAVSGMYYSAKRALAVLTLNYECPSCHSAVSVTVSGNGMYEYFDTLTGEGKPVPGLEVNRSAEVKGTPAAAEKSAPAPVRTAAATAEADKAASSQGTDDNGNGSLIWVRYPADRGTLRAVSSEEERLDRFLVHGLMPRGFDIKKAELMMPWSGASLPLGDTVHLVQLAFDMLVPYNRIASRMGISNGTFHTQLRALGRLMKPFADDILKRILDCDTVMSDESHFTIDEARKESGGNGQFFWAISPGPACEDRSVRVLFTLGRTNDIAMELLGGEDTHWKTLISDDLSEYGAVIKNTGRRHQLCMAHARRHLLRGMDPKAVSAYPEMVAKWGYRGFLTGLDREYAGKGPAEREVMLSLICLHLFNGIFALERKVSVFDRDYRETIAEIRRRWSAPLFECLTGFLEELAKTVCVRRRTGARASADKSELGAGVAYCLNNIKELREFLTNPDLCISNAISELNIAETARARCTKKILRTVDAAYCYGVLETLALSCRRNGVDFTTWLLWAYTEMAKRYSVSHGGQPLRRPVPYKVPLESLTEKQRLEMGGRRIYMENGVPHVKLHLFDSAYRHHVDELDISGLSITDFKRKCLKDIAPSGDQELILSLYMAEKAKRQGR